MFALKKHPNGIYYAHGTLNGQRIRKTLKTRDRREAKAEAARLENDLRNQATHGRNGGAAFEVMAVAYVEDGGEARFLKPIAKAFAGRDIASIKKNEIRSLARKLYPLAENSTLNRQVIVPAQAVINYAAEDERCPPIKVKRFKEKKKKSNPITRADLDRLRAHCNPYLSAILLYNLQTASRIGNTIGVMQEDLNLEQRTIRYDTTKNGEPFTVYLTDEMIRLLKQLKPRNGRVFSYKSKSSARKALKRATEKAELPYRTFHELGRHSFATHFAKLDWNSRKIADAGGWKSTRMVDDV